MKKPEPKPNYGVIEYLNQDDSEELEKNLDDSDKKSDK